MCSPGTENKQVVSSFGALPGRHNNMPELQDVLANNNALPQLCHTYHMCALCLSQWCQYLEQAALVIC